MDSLTRLNWNRIIGLQSPAEMDWDDTYTSLTTTDFCLAGPDQSSGGSGKDSKEPYNKQEADQSGTDAEENPHSITNADSPLTGDTGNLDIGKTDLGAGAVGAGDEDTTITDATQAASTNSSGTGSSAGKTIPDTKKTFHPKEDGTLSTGNDSDAGIGNA